jgi:hypothetical protein
VLFVDTSLTAHAPFDVRAVQAASDTSITTHSLSPQALMQVYVNLQGELPPPCLLLAIRGDSFELGEPPSPTALRHLDAALVWATQALQTGSGMGFSL